MRPGPCLSTFVCRMIAGDVLSLLSVVDFPLPLIGEPGRVISVGLGQEVCTLGMLYREWQSGVSLW